METANFADRLAEAVTRKRSQLAVGLDPRLDLLPMELRGEAVLGRAAAASSLARFCKGIVDAVGPYVVAVKPQSAFFEALGSDGFRALEEVCDYARSAGLLVLVDVKRGDIGSTSRAYAAAYLEPRGEGAPLADAMTASPYMGHDSVEPFLAACRRHGSGVFLLLRNSNAGAADIQDLALSDGRPLWHHVAELLREWGEQLVGEAGMSSVGAIVGATYPRAVSEARRPPPDVADAAPGSRCAGSNACRCRPCVHRRAGKRHRQRLALGDLRVPRQRGRLAGGRRGRGTAAGSSGVGRGGLVGRFHYSLRR